MPANRHRSGSKSSFDGPSPDVGKATQFQSGQSGNQSGRPKTAPLSQTCREVLVQPVPGDPEGRTYAEKIARMFAEKSAEGDIRAAQELADRAEGRPRQALEIEHTRLRDAFERMNTEELEVHAVSGTLPEWFPKEDESVR